MKAPINVPHGSACLNRCMTLLLFSEKLSNEAGIIKENTLRELTIGDCMPVYTRRHVQIGLPVRKSRESIRGSFVEIGKSWRKRLLPYPRLNCIIRFELRYGSADQSTDSCLSGNPITTEKVPQYFFCTGFLHQMEMSSTRGVRYPRIVKARGLILCSSQA